MLVEQDTDEMDICIMARKKADEEAKTTMEGRGTHHCGMKAKQNGRENAHTHTGER